MLFTPHLLVGASIGIATGNPIAAFAGGLVSHYALDAIPHADPGTLHYNDSRPYKINHWDLTIGFADLFLGLLLYIWMAGVSPLVVWAPILGAIGAVIPDVLVVGELIIPKIGQVKYLDKYFAWGRKYHKTVKPEQWILGVATQLVVIGLALWYLAAS